MLPPGKTRCIGGVYHGSEQWEAMVADKFNLASVRGMAPSDFLIRAQAAGASRDAYGRWLAAYHANDGSFLQHVAWGADRDLGQGHYLYGAMDDRYATNAQRIFASRDGLVAATHVRDKRACVIGCWDGTENLLLSALGAASADGVEEVGAFAEMARLQLSAWQIAGTIHGHSLYELDIGAMWQRYDLLYVPGVLYHLTDLPAALVICWALLAPGGVLAFESIADPQSADPMARYLGASRPGWNWWSPTPGCYEQMLRDAGFPDGRTVETSGGRGWWMGTKAGALPSLRSGAAGFSRPDILRTISGKLGR